MEVRSNGCRNCPLFIEVLPVMFMGRWVGKFHIMDLKGLGLHLADLKINDYKRNPNHQTSIDEWYGRVPKKQDRDECRKICSSISPPLNYQQIRSIIEWAKHYYKLLRDEYLCQQVLLGKI